MSKKKEDENDWVNDPNIKEFIENCMNQKGPWSEEDDKIHTVGGLTADKEKDFIKFQKKMDKNDKNEE